MIDGLFMAMIICRIFRKRRIQLLNFELQPLEYWNHTHTTSARNLEVMILNLPIALLLGLMLPWNLKFTILPELLLLPKVAMLIA